MTDELMDRYDVVVLGGGAAGLNGALMLVRSRRSVVVIDAGHPRNAPAHAVHGMLGQDGTPPAELLARGREEVRNYGGHIVDAEVAGVSRDGEEFIVTLADARAVRARRLLVATGLTDVLPEVQGLSERWGRDVLHCPYCHGWEVRDQAIGILAGGPKSVHHALLFRQLSDDIVYFSDGFELASDHAEQLAARGIVVVNGTVAALEIVGDRLSGVRMADGTVVPRAALAVSTRLEARANFLLELGLHPIDHPSGAGTYIPTDSTGRTESAGVWVAGNVTEPFAQLGASAAAGAMAGAQINADLVMEETELAVAHKHQHGGEPTPPTAEFWESFYQDRTPWTGQANGALVAALAEQPLAAGTALDLACGTGGDALWLASQSWTVTGVDISHAALAQAADAADKAGLGDRIQWLHYDLDLDFPEGLWDLVSVAYLHSPVALDRERVLRRAANAVAPGGELIIIGHFRAPSGAAAAHGHGAFPTADEVLAALDLTGWTVVRAESVTVSRLAPDGTPDSRVDNVVRLHRDPAGV